MSVISWNLQHFGKTKSDEMIGFVAETVKDYDLIAIQEVVAKSSGGEYAVHRLTRRLNQIKPKGKWQYLVSEPTSGSPNQSERYAYVVNTKEVEIIDSGFLWETYKDEIEREPYIATFNKGGLNFTLVNFHAIPKKRQPETEIKYFKFLPDEYPEFNFIFLGDFNIPQNHTVFNPLKSQGYRPVLINQKTTLRMRCKEDDDCLASEFDNIFYDHHQVQLQDGGVLKFYQSFPDMIAARKISDHVPVYFIFSKIK